MKYENIIEGIFLERRNRFVAEVLVEGKPAICLAGFPSLLWLSGSFADLCMVNSPRFGCWIIKF